MRSHPERLHLDKLSLFFITSDVSPGFLAPSDLSFLIVHVQRPHRNRQDQKRPERTKKDLTLTDRTRQDHSRPDRTRQNQMGTDRNKAGADRKGKSEAK